MSFHRSQFLALVVGFLLIISDTFALMPDGPNVVPPCKLRQLSERGASLPCSGSRKECERCTNGLQQCATRRCEAGKCIYNTRASREKCHGKPDCAICSTHSDCRPGSTCWGWPKRRCTDGTDRSLRRCFLPECARCVSSLQCASKNCWNGKCVYMTTASIFKCHPKKECFWCDADSECAQGKCWGSPQRKCTDGSYSSLRRCSFKGECSSCRTSGECATRKCQNGKCVFDTSASYRRCFPRGTIPSECVFKRGRVECP